jgi:acetate kinase
VSDGLGLAGERDFAGCGNTRFGGTAAQLAYDVFIHRLRKYIGVYLAILGRADALTFTSARMSRRCAWTRSAG